MSQQKVYHHHKITIPDFGELNKIYNLIIVYEDNIRSMEFSYDKNKSVFKFYSSWISEKMRNKIKTHKNFEHGVQIRFDYE